jgi:transposase InsO family protein
LLPPESANAGAVAKEIGVSVQTVERWREEAPKSVRPPTTHIATEPRQVWCWDMTYLPAQVLGRWFHLYLILDLYSRTKSRRL